MKVNINVLGLDVNRDIDEIRIYHLIMQLIYKYDELEVSVALRELAEYTNLSLKKVRRIVDKLEQMEIIEIKRGKGKGSANTYKLKMD
ncbi:winged helix-turn-helix transcriptional regulator [Romboutsia sp. 1001216sp1]|uniref:winged helix-turn-helix transcriptional regulator n=2 Tax=Romboutsia TaxID=1501226 RepID=UPI00232B3988|nr:winged helix-turn-helix transcriptional regulator [Romboutsia sp. 1001216sp1]